MSDIILRVENVSKQYRLGTVGTNTIGGDIQRWWTTKIRGKEDPFLKVGDVNDRTSKVKSDFVWALKDINFEVKRGEVLGIIGKNGAGKSTLLKLLSRITAPTTGSIESWGRMASLLEVGTGFHPELTGRENIFLNGAILGMTKIEIKRKLDEIIDFSGCALYIDTPVKRYSSGMTVRLGFAVAAFLDPEILIVDEVLAVGDAEFQKKAIGKMQDISKGEGRTVLFVSHNMAAVQQLCTNGLLIENGNVMQIGKVKSVIDYYFSKNAVTTANVSFDDKTIRTGIGNFQFLRVKIEDFKRELRNEFSMGEDLFISFELRNYKIISKAELAIQVKSSAGMPIFHMMCRDSGFVPILKEQIEMFTVCVNDLRLFPGDYYITLTCSSPEGHEVYDNIEDAVSFSITDGGKYTSRNLPNAAGLFFMNPQWKQM